MCIVLRGCWGTGEGFLTYAVKQIPSSTILQE